MYLNKISFFLALTIAASLEAFNSFKPYNPIEESISKIPEEKTRYAISEFKDNLENLTYSFYCDDLGIKEIYFLKFKETLRKEVAKIKEKFPEQKNLVDAIASSTTKKIEDLKREINALKKKNKDNLEKIQKMLDKGQLVQAYNLFQVNIYCLPYDILVNLPKELEKVASEKRAGVEQVKKLLEQMIDKFDPKCDPESIRIIVTHFVSNRIIPYLYKN